tara:strand:+ start:970 stop:1428 length:459 start_codon:yes stop_codon:yes gene_type:complete
MKYMSIFLACMMAMAPIYAHADPPPPTGKVTNIEKNVRAPYAGVLLDSTAASRMLVDQKYLKLEIELNLRKEFQQDLANKRLAYDLLKIEHDSLRKYHTSAIALKDQHITSLNDMLKQEVGSQHTHWWVIGGVVLGIVLSVSVFYASVEVTK